MEKLLNTDYDIEFQDKILHFTNYPELLPFVGKNWDTSKKILLIGESHYLKYDELQNNTGIDYLNNWYSSNSKSLGESFKKNIRTRNNVSLVEQGYEKERALNIYRNLRNTLLGLGLAGVDSDNGVFDKFCYYNYFQKPANDLGINKLGRSIKALPEDNIFACKTLFKIVEILKPRTIIFVSKKSFQAFNQIYSLNKTFILDGIKIDFVPHAGRQWWNKESKSYGNRTGKTKFEDLVKECYSE
jgi:hypothetical protein